MKLSLLQLHIKYFIRNSGLFLIIILSFILPAFLFLQYIKEITFISNSKPSIGTVISKTQRTGKNGILEHSIIYSFKDETTVYRSMSGVGKAKWNKLKEGDPVEIRYSKANPSENKAWRLTIFMDPFSYEFKYILFPFILTPLFLIQGLFLLAELKKDFSFIKPLLLRGLTVEGVILDTILNDDKRSPFYLIKYGFKVKEKYEGSFTYLLRYESKDIPEKDSKGNVLYMEDDIAHNMWIGDGLEKNLSINRRVKFKTKITLPKS